MVDTVPRPTPPSEVLDSHRDRAIATIQAAVAEGRLTLDQLDERAEMVEQATTREALALATADLVNVSVLPAEPRRYSAIFGSARDALGSSAMPRVITARAIFGSVALDLSEAVFTPGVTEIRCTSAFGSVELTLPAGVAVEMAGRCFFGAFERRGKHPRSSGGGSEGVTIRITGSATFGAVEAGTAAPRLALGDL